MTAHHLGPRPLPHVRRRARPPLRRPARPGRCRATHARSSTSAAAPATSPACSPTAGPRAHVTGRRQQPRDGGLGARERRAAIDASSGPTCATGARRDRVDVLVSNATLQWVPDHLDLLPRLVDAVAPGGWLAFQVPGNFEEPSHTILRELAAEAAYVDHTARRRAAGVARPGDLPRGPARPRLQADVWETTYLHVLHGEDPVFTWISATGARPVLAALPDGLRADVRDRVPGAAAGGVPARPRRGRAAVPPDLRRRPRVRHRGRGHRGRGHRGRGHRAGEAAR